MQNRGRFLTFFCPKKGPFLGVFRGHCFGDTYALLSRKKSKSGHWVCMGKKSGFKKSCTTLEQMAKSCIAYALLSTKP